MRELMVAVLLLLACLAIYQHTLGAPVGPVATLQARASNDSARIAMMSP